MQLSAEKKQPKSKWKKIVSWTVTGICILFLVIALLFLIVSFVAKKNDNRAVEIFGYSFSVVETDSMTGEIEAGELITVKICDIEEAEVGANAVFIASDGALKGRQIVHKVIKVDSDESGKYIITKGVKENAPIDEPVYGERFVGIAVKHSAFLGGVAKFFGTPVNWILILTLLIGIPCIYALVKMIVKYSKEAKKEKAEESAAEREKLKQEILEEYQKDENGDDRKE